MVLKNHKLLIVFVATLLAISLSIVMWISQNNGNLSGLDKPDSIRKFDSIPALNIQELSGSSPLIIEGTVISIEPAKWNTIDGTEPSLVKSDDTIYRDVLVKVSKVFKGAVQSDEIRVRVYGGEIAIDKNIKRVVVDSSPDFQPNEQVILFLTFDDSPYNKTKSTEFYVTRGMFQGKWTISGTGVTNKKESLSYNNLINEINNNKNYQMPKPIDLPNREK